MGKMKKYEPTAEIKGQIKGLHYGKKRIYLIDPFAVIFSLVIIAITGTLAYLSNANGFDKLWYGDILTTVDCLIGVLGILNLGYSLRENICVENGLVFLGVDKAEKTPIAFKYTELAELTLSDESGEPCEDARSWRSAMLCFALRDGSVRERKTTYLTRRKYQALRTYFLQKEE